MVPVTEYGDDGVAVPELNPSKPIMSGCEGLSRPEQVAITSAQENAVMRFRTGFRTLTLISGPFIVNMQALKTEHYVK